MKKVASLVMAFALMASSTGVALGWWSGDDVTVVNTGSSHQFTLSGSLANSGFNTYHKTDDGAFYTGTAYTDAFAGTEANRFTTNVWGCSVCSMNHGDVTVTNVGSAHQTTLSFAVANSGLNSFHNTDDGMFSTGAATALSDSQSFSNVFTTNITR